MATESTLTRCSRCGAEAPRNEMFGLEPDLLCEACSTGVRKRLAPKPVGRLANAFGGKPTPATTAILGVSVVLFLLFHVVYRNTPIDQVPDWIFFLTPGGVRNGDWWRLVTSALIHGGFIHMLFNAMWIWSLGRAVEGTRGTAMFLLIFLGSAAFASAAQVYFGRAAGIGLSGVLYALAGYLWVRRREDAVAASVLNPSTARLLFVWYLLCWFLPLGIANWAHTGGLVWGLAAGWVSTQKAPVRLPAIAALAAITVAAAWWVCTGHVA